MIDFKEIHKKPYHFTLERLDPENENVPEAIIPDDMNLHFTAEEMLMLRRFYKERGRDVEFEEFVSTRNVAVMSNLRNSKASMKTPTRMTVIYCFNTCICALQRRCRTMQLPIL